VSFSIGFFTVSGGGGRVRAAAAALFAIGAVVASTSGATGCSSDSASDAEKHVCPPGQLCQTSLTLIHTSDIHSRLFDYSLLITQVDSELGLGASGEIKTVGGVARMAYVINRERARADRVLHLDSGDVFQGAPIFNFFSGEPEVRAMSLLGTDAMAIGNHEYDRGALNVATQFMSWANFPVLGANYKFYDVNDPASTRMSSLLTPIKTFDVEGLKVGVIGMGNLSTLGSLFNQPNGLGMVPLNTAEVAQFYVDLLRPYVDVIVLLTHLGLDVDQRMVRSTTGIDMVLGGHNHIVINPPQEIHDCTADSNNPGFIWAVDPNVDYDPSAKPPPFDKNGVPLPDPVDHPYMFQRACKPRRVLIEHSGAFAKYVGRDDLILTNDPKDMAGVFASGNTSDYDPINGFEIVSNKYTVFPIDTTVPEDPVMVDMLQPYHRYLDRIADLDILVGYSPGGAKRSAPQNGDSPLGNMVAAAMWLRLGVQTDFALTNTTGIRTDMNPGPVTIEEMYNIFPFDNAITKMQLSGLEVQELFDFVARRSQGRGCVSQSQIAGARVRINCAGCSRPDANGPCSTDTDCIGATPGSCVQAPDGSRRCQLQACAEQVFIGHRPCNVDSDCGVGVPAGTCHRNDFGGTCACTKDEECGDPNTPNSGYAPGICDKGPPGTEVGSCSQPISTENLYELATSDYLAGGGSGMRVLQRNTTQFNTKIQQRDALTDYLRQGHPCGYREEADRPSGLAPCSSDADCKGEGDFVCACPSKSHEVGDTGVCKTDDDGCAGAAGLCVRRDCRDSIAQFHVARCTGGGEPTMGDPNVEGCKADLNACSLAGEECKFLACVDATIGNFTDNRVEMLGR
jgi:5'-nucleotidase